MTDIHILDAANVDHIVRMAWEDRTPFEAIRAQYGLSEAAVIRLMRRTLRPDSWRHWRAHVQGRKTKHAALRGFEAGRHRSDAQREIAFNRPSKPQKTKNT